jgi:hypothetical protein
VKKAALRSADRLAHDPTMRAITDRDGLDRRAASTSQMAAEVMVTRRLFQQILDTTAALRLLPPVRC